MAEGSLNFLYKGQAIPVAVDLDDLNDPRTKMLLRVRPGSRVLEFGCNTGFCSKALADRGCEVTGVEIDAEAARQAERSCRKVVVADVERGRFEDQIGPGRFDHVLLGGFLEHLRSPADFLRRMRPLLAEGGGIILYVPNIAHWSARLELLKGNFEYQPTGLLDSTHLFHFTRASLLKMIEECGYALVHLDATVIPVDEGRLREDLAAMGLDCFDGMSAHLNRTDAEVYIYLAEIRPGEAT